MANLVKIAFLSELEKKFGSLRKFEKTQSLFEIGEGAARVYIRYSKVHSRNRTFFGLRQEDLKRLEGYPSLLCFLWNNQEKPLLIPYVDFEDVFQSMSPANDGQYKVQVYLDDGVEFYIAGAGRFNVESYIGWEILDSVVDSEKLRNTFEYSHSQIQTFLGAIGSAKGYDIWIPRNDRSRLEWSLTERFECRDTLPHSLKSVKSILQEIDVIWIEKGSNTLRALFEVEHSTPIYSGLLRFNDIHLVAPNLHPRFSIVANDIRRLLFVRQIRRPTFEVSGLSELCSFFEYANVVGWFNRMRKSREENGN